MLMHRFLYSLLIALMFLPSLACAMPTCTGEEAVQAHEDPCASKHSQEHSTDTAKKAHLGFMSDCMGIDLQSADAIQAESPEFIEFPVLFVTANDFNGSVNEPSNLRGIRGPPPNDLYPFYSKPSFILTTKRFRI